MERIREHVTRLEADEQVRVAMEHAAARQRRMTQIEAVQSGDLQFDLPVDRVDVSPVDQASVAESDPASGRGWFRRRRRRERPADQPAVAPGDEEEPLPVDDVDRENDDAPELPEVPGDDAADEEWATALEQAAAADAPDDENVYAALASDDDDFPWDDEDWSGATS